MSDNIYDMDLHSEIVPHQGMSIIRVPGGWIYMTATAQQGGHCHVSQVFVPFHNEFMQDLNKTNR